VPESETPSERKTGSVAANAPTAGGLDDPTAMTLLVQACSKSKHDDPAPAFALYDGYYYRILKKAMREDAFDWRLDVLILSAEHGLLDPCEHIAPYDRRMTNERAREFRDEGLPGDLAGCVTDGEYERVVVNVGATYATAIDGFEGDVDAPVSRLSGGLGERGNTLKRLVRTDEQTPDELAVAGGESE